MLVCRKCGAAVEDGCAATVREYAGPVGEERAYYDRAVCPECRSDALCDGERCAVCGELVPEDETVCGICEKCAEEAAERFGELMGCSFSARERELLQELLESCRISII